MSENDLKTELVAIGAWDEKGHYEYSSGRHGNTHLDKYTLSIYPRMLKLLGEAMAEAAKQWKPDIVVSPAYSGISISQWTASALEKMLQREILALYVVKSDQQSGHNKFGFIGQLEEYLPGKRIVILEDNINTGRSIIDIRRLIEDNGGKVVGVVSIMNRGKVNFDDLPLETLLKQNFQTSLAQDCELCPAPLTKPIIRKTTRYLP